METEKNSKLLELARQRFTLCEKAEEEIRREALLDLRFYSGDQWEERTRREREFDARPVLTFNKLTGPVQQISNDARQNKPGLRVSGVDMGADPELAKVMQGIIRHIEYDSSADIAYDTALEYAAAAGFGYIRISTDYCDPGSFDQSIKIERVLDPFSVYLDPSAKEADGSDARFAFVIERMTREEYRARFGEKTEIESFWTEGTHSAWVSEDDVLVAEYWTVEDQAAKLCACEDGQTRYEDEMPEGMQPVKTRDSYRRKVTQRVINAAEVLETAEWSGSYIPIIPVWGKELIVEGKRHLISVIRHARDPQRLHNFYKTIEAETISLAPRPKWVGPVGSFATKKGDWAKANRSNLAYLEYDVQTDPAGNALGAPRYERFEPPIAALSAGAMQTGDDIKSATNVYDASLGARSNETSGIAIQRRQRESDVSNFHFLDNLSRSLKHVGRQLLELIPKIYDTERQVRIIGEDETERIVQVNAPYQDQQTGKMQHYQLDAGRYDVTVKAGPSYETRRQEMAEQLSGVLQAAPGLMNVIGDLYFRNADMAGGDEIADRVKKFIQTTQPGLIEDAKQQQAEQIPQQVQAQMQQMGQLIQQLTERVNQQSEEARTKKLELDSRERIATLQTHAQLVMTEAKIASQEGIEQLRQEIASIGRMVEQQHARDMMGAEQDYQLQAGEMQHQRGIEAAEGDHQRQMEAGDMDHARQMQRQQATQDFSAEQGDMSHQRALEMRQMDQAEQPEQI